LIFAPGEAEEKEGKVKLGCCKLVLLVLSVLASKVLVVLIVRTA